MSEDRINLSTLTDSWKEFGPNSYMLVEDPESFKNWIKNNIVDPDSMTGDEPVYGWVTGKIKCDLCANESISVHHNSCDKLECSNCRQMTEFAIIDE